MEAELDWITTPRKRSAPPARRSRDHGVIVPSAGWYCGLKRLLDVAAAGVLFVVLLPVMLLAALLVKCTSRGSVFYRQVRLGKDGQPFRVWKFRTMVEDAEAQTGPVWSHDNDPRVTRIGRVLRDTHIDEFPQLLNVLWGSMSLVGPRPERPELVDELERLIPPYRLRMLVRPGITGFAQVRLPPDTDLAAVRSKVAYDLYYIQHYTFWMDVQILLLTGLEFSSSVERILRSWFPLPADALVEKLHPYLLSEAAAQETFAPRAPHFQSSNGADEDERRPHVSLAKN